MGDEPYEIDDFVRLDDTVTDADEFVNAHDLNRFYRNHNKLIAARNRRCIIASQTSPGDSSATQGNFRGFGDATIVSSGTRMVDVEVMVSAHVQEVTFWMYAAKSTNDITVYARLTALGSSHPVDTTNGTISVTSGTAGKVSVDLPTPPVDGEGNGFEGGFRFMRFMALIDDGTTSSTAKGGGPWTISAVGDDWVEDNSGQSMVGAYCVITTDSDIEPRLVKQSDGSGGTRVHTMSRPWNRTPKEGVDTTEYYTMDILKVYSWGLYEKPITEFDSAKGLI